MSQGATIAIAPPTTTPMPFAVLSLCTFVSRRGAGVVSPCLSVLSQCVDGDIEENDSEVGLLGQMVPHGLLGPLPQG